MSADTDDEFQKELIALFVQEAQEWLQQIHVALDELQQSPPADRHLKLAHTIKAGLTNLGGSAATIGLHEVEKVSFIGIPLVEAVENPSLAPSATAFLALCRQLGKIHDALTGATFQAESAPANVVSGTVPAQDLLIVLHELRCRLAAHAAIPCRVTKTIIAQLDSMTKNGMMHCDASSLRDVLERGAQAEQAFAQAVRQLGPLVAEGLGKISRSAVDQSLVEGGEWKMMVDRTGELWAASQKADAVEAMTFFTGLQSFLTIVMTQRVMPAAGQFEKVEARLREIPAIIQEWAEAGRRERGGIEAMLPAV